MFCVNCGSALSAGAGSGAPPTAAPMYPGAMPGLPSAWDAERRRQIDRTKTGFLIILVVGTIVTGLASVFFTYAIQNQTGRMLLLGGYVARIVLQIAIFVVVSQAVGTFVAAMFPGGTYNPTAAAIAAADFSARVQTLGCLSAIPALIYAGAYYLVWNRINKGEIPASTTPPPMAAAPLPPR